jgi:hypothetical protein
VAEGVRAVNLPRPLVVVFVAVLLFVAAALLVSTTQGTSSQLGLGHGGQQQYGASHKQTAFRLRGRGERAV